MGILHNIQRLRLRKADNNRKMAFQEEYSQFVRLAEKSAERFELNYTDVRPCLSDKTTTTHFDRHYIYHPAWAARILRETAPACHVDIASTLYFCSIVSAFIPVKFYDYRPAELQLSDLFSDSADLLSLPFQNNSIVSLSCMHTVEHVGLGRYGDPLDYDGDIKSIAELRRVVAQGGNLLFVVPIGQPRIVFNAHRIYSYDQVLSYFPDCELVEFALVPDDPNGGGIIKHASRELANAQIYGCGCFWFRKKG